MNATEKLKSEEYNGWPSKAHWNVNLWLNNSEGTYLAMLGAIKDHGVKQGTQVLFHRLKGMWKWDVSKNELRTPDGILVTHAILEYVLASEME